ncbi:ABI gene family member 3-like isoform X1 [Scleropages formosus]|uniref:ABI gene family member 3 n=1 Tax=Scleropages formosus TaxID=113540 RepID=A0A8C9V0A7_SCLFO|nr:ABI gene family member 3-like isoform X1 [Scleropages formosus]
MKDQNSAENIQAILQEAPAARRALLDNYENLHKVAEYCEHNYLKAEGSDTKKALEETKAFATQSLASVAYQISTLASNVLKLLDAQTVNLGQMESSINLIAQTVDMHREKVARREIGVFTTVKKVPRSQKVIPPAIKEQHPKYSRTPISYTALDTIGHGMKDSGTQLSRIGTLNRKQSSREAGGTLGRTARPREPVQCPVAPTVSKASSVSSLTDRSVGSSFGIAVPPPMVPDFPAPDFTVPPLEDSIPPLLVNTDMPPPPSPPPSAISMDVPPPPPPPPPPLSVPGPSIPPPPPLLETVAEENSFPLPSEADTLPAPVNDTFELPVPPSFEPEDFNSDMEFQAPPPPPDNMDAYDDIMPPLPPPVDYDQSAPGNYLEKVVALYSYNSDKPGDLCFEEGAIIYLTKRNDNGWCEGVLNGMEGFFPENYVEPTS